MSKKTGTTRKIITPEVVANVVKSAQKTNAPSENDDFAIFYGKSNGAESPNIMEPPYDISNLVDIPGNNSILRQCIDAMEVGCVGFGAIVERCDDSSDETQSKQERSEIETILSSCHPFLSFGALLRRLQRDRMYTGMGFWEVVRSRSGKHIGFNPLLPQYCRLCREDEVPTEFSADVLVDDKIVPRQFITRFRRFCMQRGNKIVYFKQWGDKRKLNKDTGEYVPENEKISEDLLASEILYFPCYSPKTEPYGEPVWINQIENIIGVNDATIVRSAFFRSKGIPAFLITVSGGTVSQSTIDRIEEFLTSLRDMDDPAKAFYSCLVIHAQADGNASAFLPEDRIKEPVIKIEPISQLLEQDSLFTEFTEKTRENIRGSFRLSPLMLGEGKDVSKGSAETARQVSEEWVFQPERKIIETAINTFFVREHGMRFNVIHILGPDLSDYDKTTQALSRISGAVTPNDLRDMAGKILKKDLPRFDSPWADEPLIMMANAAGLSALNEKPARLDKDILQKIADARGEEDFNNVMMGVFKA
jgi:PBSX family phage portal protein